MKNSQTRGFANIILIVAVVILAGALGYVALVKKSTPAEQPQSNDLQSIQPVAIVTNNTLVQKNTVSNWQTYTNSQHGYWISFPQNTKVNLLGVGFDGTKWTSYSPENSMSPTTSWYASTCVSISDSSGDWYIYIASNSSQVPCSATGTSANNYPSSDTLVINGTQIVATGRVEKDKSGAVFNFNLNKIVTIEYVIQNRTGIGMSEQDYQNALVSIHNILSTLKTVKDFVPILPLDDGSRG